MPAFGWIFSSKAHLWSWQLVVFLWYSYYGGLGWFHMTIPPSLWHLHNSCLMSMLDVAVAFLIPTCSWRPLISSLRYGTPLPSCKLVGHPTHGARFHLQRTLSEEAEADICESSRLPMSSLLSSRGEWTRSLIKYGNAEEIKNWGFRLKNLLLCSSRLWFQVTDF